MSQDTLLEMRFNPTLVRLRQGSEASPKRKRESFNPTLVRLRPGHPLALEGLRERFQSHAGSIEAPSRSP